MTDAKPKWTPGKWTAIKPEGAPYWGIRTTSYQTTVAGTASGLSEADARLCAAAPDLYKALRELMPLMDFMLGIGDAQPEEGSIAYKARAALAKAEGRNV